MNAPFRSFFKFLPSVLLAIALAVAVWISAVTAADPVEEKIFPRLITIDLVGQNPSLILTGDPTPQISVTLSAPHSIWDRLINEQVVVRAAVDLAGLPAGTHNVPVQIQVGIRPVQVISYAPRTLTVSLESLTTRTLSIRMVRRGELAVGFQAETPTLTQSDVIVSGPRSAVERVAEVQAILDLERAQETINRVLPLQAVDANETIVQGVTLTPNRVTANQIITQRGGYRNVVVKVNSYGKVANGYRLTNITVSPPAVTVFSTNPQQVNNMPGYIDTAPLSLNNVKDDFDTRLALNLPQGVSVVGDQTVLVQVGVAAIEGSLTITNNKVEVIGLPDGWAGKVSPETVDVILSGPLPVLDALKPENLRVYIDLSNVTALGTYQRSPQVELRVRDLLVESILPNTVEVIVLIAPTPSPTPRK